MKAIENTKTLDFLRILNQVSFDEQLFRKEFLKTLNWIPKNNHPEILVWMVQNGYNKQFPDLMTRVGKKMRSGL